MAIAAKINTSTRGVGLDANTTQSYIGLFYRQSASWCFGYLDIADPLPLPKLAFAAHRTAAHAKREIASDEHMPRSASDSRPFKTHAMQ